MVANVSALARGVSHSSLATMNCLSPCFSSASASWSARRLWKCVSFGRFILATAKTSIPEG